MIVVSGFKVFPNEIEDVLTMHPDVLEAAAIGVRDERSSEVVKVVIVPNAPTLTEAVVLSHCKRNLTGYELPRVIEFCSEPLLKSNIGKILRRELRDGGAATPVGPPSVAGEPIGSSSTCNRCPCGGYRLGHECHQAAVPTRLPMTVLERADPNSERPLSLH